MRECSVGLAVRRGCLDVRLRCSHSPGVGEGASPQLLPLRLGKPSLVPRVEKTTSRSPPPFALAWGNSLFATDGPATTPGDPCSGTIGRQPPALSTLLRWSAPARSLSRRVRSAG